MLISHSSPVFWMFLHIIRFQALLFLKKRKNKVDSKVSNQRTTFVVQCSRVLFSYSFKCRYIQLLYYTTSICLSATFSRLLFHNNGEREMETPRCAKFVSLSYSTTRKQNERKGENKNIRITKRVEICYVCLL